MEFIPLISLLLGLVMPIQAGKVKEFSNQFIESKFTFFFIPVTSTFIVQREKQKRQEITIPINSASIKAYYHSFLLIFGPPIVLFTCIFFHLGPELPVSLAYLPLLITLACSAYCIYRAISLGKSQPFEIKRRTVLELALGINALPEWLTHEQRTSYFKQLAASLPADWHQRIALQNFSSSEYYKLYAAIYYDTVIAPTPEKEKLFKTLDIKINRDVYRNQM